MDIDRFWFDHLVSFLSWVCYLVFAKSTKAGFWATVQLILGLFVGAAILGINGALQAALGVWALGFGVAALAGALTLLERTPPLEIIPAYYLGAITLFASGLEPSQSTFVKLATPMIFGAACGWVTTWARSNLVLPTIGREIRRPTEF